MVGSSGPLWAAILGIAGTLVFDMAPGAALGEGSRPSSSQSMMLVCDVSGGGYAIEDASGRVLENGDGAPFSPQPHAVLHLTATPPRVRVAEGVLPHPDCASGPVLEGFAPVSFTWCTARYEILPDAAGTYILRSTSRSTLTSGPHRGDIMEAFMVGGCVVSDPSR